MRSVLETATAADEAPTAPKLCKQIERCATLLKKSTGAAAGEPESAKLTKQARGLFEVQAYCQRKDWPQGLIKKLFYNLYETDVVFEDAYAVWREDTSDTTPGKNQALFAVNEFLQWLNEAAEDSGGDDDEAS